MRKRLKRLLDLLNLVMKPGICHLLLIQHVLNLEHWLSDLGVMLVAMMSRGRLSSVAYSGKAGTSYLRFEDLLREILDWWPVDGLGRRSHFPIILRDAHDGCASEIENESLMLIDLLWCLEDTCWLCRRHGCQIIHLRFVEGVLEGSSVNLCQISCRIILSQAIESMHAIEPSGTLGNIRPEIRLVDRSTFLLTFILF